MIPPGVQGAVFLALKIATLIGLGVYVIFSLIMVRQEQLMAKVLEEHFEPILRTLVFVHLLASVAVFGAALLFL